ncbi:helix-hairpin-helix domain-containing protein [Herbiconiux sp. A18JL235]|uniref:Helix-hairpin-helix domain-containing protein n=1 Tax=Herbiconiux sp. A18JL235 TaxID=3152363 RepID=A0AB39BD13_9MICO
MSLPEPPPNAAPTGPSVRVRVGVGAAVVLVVAALVVSVLITALAPMGATTVVAGSAGADSGAGPTEPPAGLGVSAVSAETPDGGNPTPAPIMVHLLGAVAAPGVYELASGARVVDVVVLAGGFTDQAERSSVNLARPLVDGEQLRVLAVGEAPPEVAPGSVGGASGGSGASGGVGASAGAGAGGVIDLNRATAADLDTLPRIGPAMAARIVAWRDENGPFSSIDDLLQVTGIGEKTLEGLRDLVRV